MPRTENSNRTPPSATAGNIDPGIADLLRPILARDGWTLERVREPLAGAPGAVYLARHGRRRIAFFFSNQPARQLTRAFDKIRLADRGRFSRLGVLVAPTTAAMQRLRSVSKADRCPRAFFASLEELREVAAMVSSPATASPGAAAGRRSFPAGQPEPTGAIQAFRAEVLANTPVGGPGSSHYRLAFRARQLQDVQPPQFIMMDPTAARVKLGARAVRRATVRGAVDLAPRPLLKRPFGICRDFHRHFAVDYLRRLDLPPTLALALHIAAPDHFDLLYKVLPDGVGTPLMTQLRRGQKIEMVGPLGRPFDVRRLRAAGIEEVHVIGGGVGMAPLILLVESLRYYSFHVKVFLGIARLESLRYRDELAATFGERPRDAYIYIDDLLAAGVKPADLYVSCDSETPARVVRGIPPANLYHGLVPDQYRRFLEEQDGPSTTCHPERSEGSRRSEPRRDTNEILRDAPQRLLRGSAQNDDRQRRSGVLAFACGPNRMMEIVAEIARQAEIGLRVLLEKRMACGMGVCFSCVCKVRRPGGGEDYARICTEGPLFDARDIVWKNDDSKFPSASSSCAARC